MNLQSLNSQFLFVGREKMSKNPYEIKVRGLVSIREGVAHPKRLRYSEGASYLNYLVLIICLITCKIYCLKSKWKNGGRRCMFLLFLLIWKDESFAYLPKKMGSKSSSSLSKIIFVCWVNFKVFEKWFFLRRDERPQGMRMKKVWDCLIFIKENKV